MEQGVWRKSAVAAVLIGAGSVAVAAGAPTSPVRDCSHFLSTSDEAHGPGATLGPSARRMFDEAAAQFRARRYAAALGAFSSLADAGHVPSARIALVMVENGRSLFGSEWSASLEQQCRWQRLLLHRAQRGPELFDDGRGD
jgi:hypothetical protein